MKIEFDLDFNWSVKKEDGYWLLTGGFDYLGKPYYIASRIFKDEDFIRIRDIMERDLKVAYQRVLKYEDTKNT